MNYYSKLIIEATGCSEDAVNEIEELMRDEYSTLNGLSPEKFKRAAKAAYETYKYMQSDEGKAYIEMLKTSIYNVN